MRLTGLFMLLVLCASCNKVYQRYTPVEGQSWNYKAPKTFSYNLSPGDYALAIDMRNTDKYPFSNIWVTLTIKGPDGSTVNRQYNLTLAEPDGRWTGAGPGGFYDNRFVVEDHMNISQAGAYTFTLQQDMRLDNLEGIADIGIRVSDSQKSPF